jgi:ABC-type multidrug transport system fused ATPase/permease subunit
MKTYNKILLILTKNQKKNFFILSFIAIIVAFIEMLGVFSIYPFITIITNPQLIESNFYLNKFFGFSTLFGVSNKTDFIFFFGILVFIVLTINQMARASMTYAQIRFSHMCQYSISQRLFKIYLKQNYVWFLVNHSSNFNKKIISETDYIIHQTLLPFMILISQSAVILAIIAMILVIDPLIAVVLGLVLVPSYLIIYYKTKNLLSKAGTIRVNSDAQIFKMLAETFHSIKQVKIMSIENEFLGRFSNLAKIKARSLAFSGVLSNVPRYAIEILAFGGMIILVLFFIKAYPDNLANTISFLTLYAFAGYRLMPSLNQFFHSISLIKYSKTSLDQISDDLRNLEIEDKNTQESKVLNLLKEIRLQNISFTYPNKNSRSLNNINIIIPAFKNIGIAGTNGSGKTTLIDIILGLLVPNEGNLMVDGNAINSKNKFSWQKNIGYVPQDIILTDNSILENIAFGKEKKDIDFKRVENSSRIACIDNYIKNNLKAGYNTIIGERGQTLSGGQKQRIGIARALYQNPSLLILDEATSSIDNYTERIILNNLNQLKNKITIIMIAHKTSTLQLCDYIFLLNNGSIVNEGLFEDLKFFLK